MIRRVCGLLMLAVCSAELWGCEDEGRCVTEADCFRGEVCASNKCTTRGDMAPALDLGADQAVEPDSAPDLGDDMAPDMAPDMASGCGVGLALCGGACVPCGEGASTFTCERGDQCTITACGAGYTLSGATGRCEASEHINPVLVAPVRDAWAAYSPAGRAHVVVGAFSGGRDKLYVRSWSPGDSMWVSSPEVNANAEVSVASDTRGQLHVVTFDAVDDLLYHRWDERWETMTLPIKTASARIVPLADGDMWLVYIGAQGRGVWARRWSASMQRWEPEAQLALGQPAPDQEVRELDVACDAQRCTLAMSAVMGGGDVGALQVWSAPQVGGAPSGWAQVHELSADADLDASSFEQVRLHPGRASLAHVSFVARDGAGERRPYHLPVQSAQAVGALSTGPALSALSLTGVAPGRSAEGISAVGASNSALFSRDPTMMGWPEQGVRIAEPGVSHELVSDGEGWWWLYDVNSTENSSLQVLRLAKLQ